MKNTIRSFARGLNILLSHTSRIGIELENDLARLTASDPISIIFDVGANHGQSAKRFSRSYPLAQIYCFEPVSSNFKILQSSCSQLPKIKLINKGLGKESAKAIIGLSENPGGHSLLLADSAENTETIEIVTIDQFARENQIEKIDLLKIDVEGMEIDVLEGAKTALAVDGIRFVYAECIFEPDDSSPHTLFAELHHYLSNCGFSFFACYHESFHLAAGSAMGNVLFVNKRLLPAKVAGRVQNIV